MPRRRKRVQEPNRVEYRAPAALKINTPAGYASLWLQRIERAARMLDLPGREQARIECLPYINGEYRNPSSGDLVYLNEALPALEDMIFGTFPGMPPVQAEARQIEHEGLADMAAALIDGTLQSGLCRAQKAILACEWDEIGWGIAFFKTAWLSEDQKQDYRPTGDQQYLTPHVMAAMAENANPTSARVAEHDDDAVHIQVHAGAPGIPQEHIEDHYKRLGWRKWAQPVVLRVDPKDFVYDPDTEEWEERAWEAELCEELVSSLEQIPGIKNLNPVNCPAVDEFGNREDGPREDSSFDFEQTRVPVWKIHDRFNGGYIILPAGKAEGTLPLLEADWPYGGVEIYNKIVHRPWTGRVHGLATLRLITPLLQELAKTNAAIRRHIRRASNPKLAGPRTVKDKEFERELEDPNKWMAHYSDIRMGALMKEFKPGSLPKEVPEYREMLLAELRRILGSDIMHQGGDTPHEISAREAFGRQEYQEKRLSRRKGEISDALSWMARNIVLLYRDWAEEDISVRVMTPQGAQVQLLDPAAIPEDLMIKLDIEALSETKQAMEVQSSMQYAQMVMQLTPETANRVALVVWVGQKLGIANPEKFQLPPGQGMVGQPAEAGGVASLPAGGAQPGGPYPRLSQTKETPAAEQQSPGQQQSRIA